MAEPRSHLEGTLRWVVQSGSGLSWATASAPTSGLIGYCENFQFTSGQDVQALMDRGIPKVNKLAGKQAITLSFDVLWGITGDYPTFVSGSGATQPMIAVEFKATAPEAGAAMYYQFYGVALQSIQMSETTPANRQTWTMQGLAMGPVTGSGYLG